MPDEPSPEQPLAEQLRSLLRALEVTGNAFLPGQDQGLLRSIVEAAAQIFGAAAASIALVDEAEQSIVFRVSVGAGSENVIGLSIPLDQGIAGYVVMTGQPISVSDVQKDTRFNQGFASSTGYVPRSILATPLLVGDRVIGVMEVLDKINAASFGMQDMDLLAVFARQAAIAIHQSQQYEQIGEALVAGLRNLVDPQESQQLASALDTALAGESEPDITAIAEQLNQLIQLGSAEQHLCLEVLQAFGQYARRKALPY